MDQVSVVIYSLFLIFKYLDILLLVNGADVYTFDGGVANSENIVFTASSTLVDITASSNVSFIVTPLIQIFSALPLCRSDQIDIE